MIIVQYSDLQSATDKVNEYSILAYPNVANPAPLVMIFKHWSLPIWFFVGTDCINNGGINKQAIADDIATLNFTFEVEGVTYNSKFEINQYDDLRDLGYWPNDDI